MNKKKQATSIFHVTPLVSTIRLFLFLGFVAFAVASCAPPEDTPDCDNTSDAKEEASCDSDDASDDTPPEDPSDDTPPGDPSDDTPSVDTVDPNFISTWRTTAAFEDVVIPVNGGSYTYDYSVDCDDDGTFELQGQTGDATCRFDVSGDHKIKISGTFPALFINNRASIKDKFIAINNWGTNKWRSMKSAFKGAANFNSITATDKPDFSAVTDMSEMFREASAFNQSLAGFNTDNVTNMKEMFREASAFNQSLAGFNTDNVTIMFAMFSTASAFNQSLANFNTDNITDMSYMFYSASAFNQPLANFNTAKVTSMFAMFSDASAFNQSLAGFNTAGVTNMIAMFSNATAFNQPLTSWDVGNVTTYIDFSTNSGLDLVNIPVKFRPIP